MNLLGRISRDSARAGGCPGGGHRVRAATASLRGVATTIGMATDCRLRFAGRYHDPETGLHYNLHRYYDPVTGRYQSSDPLGLAAAADPHGYVRTPAIRVDPLGLLPRDPRNLPGIATGSAGLRDIAGRWLRGTNRNAG
jgi:RHS repeat-associated protein